MECIHCESQSVRYAHCPSWEREKYPAEVEAGICTLVYRSDHHVRYRHIPAEERWKYPDEVKVKSSIIWGPYRREKTKDKILSVDGKRSRKEHKRKLSPVECLLSSKDVPIDKACDAIPWGYSSRALYENMRGFRCYIPIAMTG